MKHSQKGASPFLFCAIGYVFVLWAAVIVADAIPPKTSLFHMIDPIMEAFQHPFDLHFSSRTVTFVIIFTIAYAFAILYISTSWKNKRVNEEHGSSKWGDIKAIVKKYRDANPFNNLILSDSLRLSFDGHKVKRNANVLVIGGSGAGKSRSYAKPNLMQCNTSFIVTDPSGELLRSCGYLLIEKGYQLKVIDLINMTSSFKYNPFVYIRDEKDIVQLVTNFFQNTKEKGRTGGDQFWEDAAFKLMHAIMSYIFNEVPAEQQNFDTFLYLLDLAKPDDDGVSPLDYIFMNLHDNKPDSYPVRIYNGYKTASGKTASSILITLHSRLKCLIPDVVELLSKDEIEMDKMGETKTAIFCVVPDYDTSFNFVIGMFYTQAIQTLSYLADNVYKGGFLPVHVHFLMDEFANVALPDDFDKFLASCRKRHMSVTIILQNLSQLKALFEKQWESIAGNCDSLIYLGGMEQSGHEYISKLLGKETIVVDNSGYSRGTHRSYSSNEQKSGRELLTPDEVRMLDNKYSIVVIRGEYALMDLKYDPMKHPNIKSTTDGGSESYINKNHKFGDFVIYYANDFAKTA